MRALGIYYFTLAALILASCESPQSTRNVSSQYGRRDFTPDSGETITSSASALPGRETTTQRATTYPDPGTPLSEHEPATSPAPLLLEREIKIETDPPGARIEVNDEYEGVAPITVSVPANPDGTWKLRTEITALPRIAGQQVQIKFFEPFDKHQIPKRVLFDMHLVSPRPAIDMNLNPDE